MAVVGLEEGNRRPDRRSVVGNLHPVVNAMVAGEHIKVAALPKVTAAVLEYVREELVGVTEGVLFLIDELVGAVLDGVKSEASRACQHVAVPAFDERIDTHAASAGGLIAHEIIILIVVAHKSLGTSYPQTTLTVDQKIGYRVVGYRRTVVVVMKISGEMVTVEFVETIFGTNPNVAVTVLDYTVNK